MKKLLTLTLLSIASTAMAQSYTIAKYGINEFENKDFFTFNSAAIDHLSDFDAEVAFGIEGERRTLIETGYTSSYIIKGKEAIENAYLLSFEDRGPLFSGESYTIIRGVLPLTSGKEAKRLDLVGGWLYNINSYMTFDIGGTISLTDKRTLADGISTGSDYIGESVTGDFWVAFMGDMYMKPFISALYNFDYEQYQFSIGFAPVIDLSEIMNGLSLDITAYYAYTSSNTYTGDSPIDWKNSYYYVYGLAQLSWEYEHFKISAGIGYTWNSDGSGYNGVLGMNLGDSSNLFGTFSIGYIF